MTFFVSDIRPLFRAKDVKSMKCKGFDLSNYDDVSARADAILGRLRSGTMPCDGAWLAGKVELFAEWIADGKRP